MPVRVCMRAFCVCMRLYMYVCVCMRLCVHAPVRLRVVARDKPFRSRVLTRLVLASRIFVLKKALAVVYCVLPGSTSGAGHLACAN